VRDLRGQLQEDAVKSKADRSQIIYDSGCGYEFDAGVCSSDGKRIVLVKLEV
jgi:hypothetical protein